MLTTPRLSLAPVRPEDWQGYAPIFTAPETSAQNDLPANPSEKRTRGFVDAMARLNASGRGRAWMIREIGAHQILGCIRINRIDKRHAAASVGYEILPAAWGRGLASEALGGVAAHCFSDLAIFRLEAWAHGTNTASHRVLEKTGFQREGIQRQKVATASGRADIHLFARLNDL